MKTLATLFILAPCAAMRWAVAGLMAGLIVWPALALAQAGASARTSTEATPGCLGADGVPSGSSTSVVTIANLASGVGGGGTCTSRGSGFAYAGVIGASAHSGFVGFGSNGAVAARASSSWNDGLNAVWPSTFSVSNLGSLRLNYNIGATGGVSGSLQTRSFDDVGVATGSAEIGYDLSVGNNIATGTQKASAGRPAELTGTWGTISGSVELTPNGGSSNDYRFAPIGLSLTGYAKSRVQHSAHNEPLSATAAAEFGSTLIWQGIVGIEAFDTNGDEIDLPLDFELALIGSQTGMNYWDAAVRDPGTDPLPGPVPEPHSWALVAAGLAGLVARRGRLQ